MQTFQKNLTRLDNSLENFDAAKTERIGSPSLGDVVRQGDLYLVCIDEMPTKNARPSNNPQLVPGTSQGSRHILANGKFQIVNGHSFNSLDPVYVGPAFHCKTDVEVTHPEHGNKILPEDSTWQCVYQMAWAEEARRIED